MLKREKVLSIKELSISFQMPDGGFNAVRGLNLSLYRGETLAIVGESGSGKSATARAVMGLLGKDARIDGGAVYYTFKEELPSDPISKKGQVDLLKLSKKERQKWINGRQIAMVFQDPMTSLNPAMTIGSQVMEGMRCHDHIARSEAFEKSVRLLEMVGISQPEKRMKSYPHQLSGGMRQRVVIAAALACRPEVLICDEPTTALDVTIQARILELIKNIQEKTGISVIYITHDLGVVARIADYVAVMHRGKILEKGLTDEIFFDPRHPYTWGLLSAVSDLDTGKGQLYNQFASHREFTLNIDYRLEPPMFRVTDTHYAATWLLHESAPAVDLPIELRNRIKRMKEEAKTIG